MIPLTPDTSFEANRGGSVWEKALMYAILAKMILEEYQDELETLLIHGAIKAWDWARTVTRTGLRNVNKINKIYPANVLDSIIDYFQEKRSEDMLAAHLKY